MTVNHIIIIICMLISSQHASDTTPFLITSVKNLQIHNTFTSESSSSFQTLLIHKNTLYIGGKNQIHGRDIGNISESSFKSVTWNVNDEAKQICPRLPHSDKGGKCYSQIQLIQPFNETHLITCGTNSLTPENRFLLADGSQLVEQHGEVQDVLCSYDPSDKVASYSHDDGGHSNTIFAATRKDLNFDMSLVKTVSNGIIETSDNKQSSNTEYVGSFLAVDRTTGHASTKIYFISNEPNDDSSEKMTTTVTQLCANDIGGSKFIEEKWTSLLKLRIACSTDEGLVFDIVKDAFVADDGFLYGVFTTKYQRFRVSALCAFRISDLQQVFNSGDLVSDALPSMRSRGSPTFPFKGDYTPGMCAYPGMNNKQSATSKDFPVDFLKYMDSHYMMSQSAQPSFPLTTGAVMHDPILVKNEETFVKIVTTTVRDLNDMSRVVGFIATDTGCVYKYTAIEKNQHVETIEIAKYKLSNEGILSMEQDRGYLYVGTNSTVHQISMENCGAYTHSGVSDMSNDACRMCVLARDPMCAFNHELKTCVSVTSATNKASLLQDVTNGDAIAVCGEISSMATRNTTKEAHIGETIFYGNAVPDNVKVQWSFNGQAIKDSTDKYRITADKQLIVHDFDVSDVGTYVCQYLMKYTLVAMETITTTIPGVLPPGGSPATVTTMGPPPLPTTNVANDGLVTMTTHLEMETTNVVTAGVEKVGTASITIAVLVVIFVTMFLLVITAFVYKRYCSRRRNKQTMEDKIGIEVADSAVPREMQPMTQNDYNNSNNHSLGGSSESQGLLNDEEPPHYQPPNNRAKSMDFLADSNDISFADEDDREHSRSVARTHSSNEISHKRKRTPTRTKSQPLQSRISVNFGGRKDLSFDNCTLTRNKKGKWVLELPTEFSPSTVANVDKNSPQDDAADGSYNFGAVDGSREELKAPLARVETTLENDVKNNVSSSPAVLPDETLRSSNSKQNLSSDESDTTIQASNLTLKPSTPDVTPKIKITPSKSGRKRQTARRFDDPVEHLHGQNEQRSPAKSSHSLSSSSSTEDSVYKSARSSLNSDLVT